MVSTLLLPMPAWGAERIYLSYGLLERSISFAALEAYAKTGALDDDLYVYSNYVNEVQRQQLRQVLEAKADISPVAISQFLYSPQGKILLKRLGQVIQPEARVDGDLAIRAALILAATDKQKGLTPLNVVRKFPTRGIRIDLLKTLQIADELESLVTQTRQYTQAIVAQANQAATQFPMQTQGLPDLSMRGRSLWDKLSWPLEDKSRPSVEGFVRSRSRQFPMDLYLPRGGSQAPGSVPLVVISHGLGSDRSTFAYLAEHLASYGFAVAVPEHPRSNAKQMEALLQGIVKEVAAPSEFVDRPLDIRYVLNYLTQQASSNPSLRRLNLRRVGVIGQSFGGYTALALAGAPLNFSRLAQACTEDKQVNTFNISLLLQCRALELPQKPYELADPRVAAILAVNPIDSAVFGPESLRQIQIPTMIVSGDADTVAPAVPEQIVPFSWLQSPDRYLVLIDRASHFSTLAESAGGSDPLPIPPEIVGPSPALARRYINGLSVAFFRSYLTNQAASRSYLTSAYVQTASQSPLKLSLVNSFDPSQVHP